MDPKIAQPQMRCRQIQDDLKALALLDAAVKNRVLDRFPKDALQIIQATKEDQWVPVDYEVMISDLIGEEGGEKGAIDFGWQSFERSIESSLVGPFFRTALSVFKIKPSSALKLAPHLWISLYRHCGTLSVVTKTRNSVQIIFEDLPPILIKSRFFLLTLVGSLRFLLSYTHANGTVVLEQQSKDTGRAVISVTWDVNTS